MYVTMKLLNILFYETTKYTYTSGANGAKNPAFPIADGYLSGLDADFQTDRDAGRNGSDANVATLAAGTTRTARNVTKGSVTHTIHTNGRVGLFTQSALLPYYLYMAA